MQGAAEADATRMRERLEWLVEFCCLGASAERMLHELIDAPLTSAALSARLALDERVVAAELLPSAPLRHWGLVRCDEGRIAVNRRIDSFLRGG